MSDTYDPVLEYLNGADRVGFEGYVPRGRGKQPVRVLLRPEVIVALAKYLTPVMGEREPGARGHAFWHYQRPREPYPCSQCPRALSAESGTTGDAKGDDR